MRRRETAAPQPWPSGWGALLELVLMSALGKSGPKTSGLRSDQAFPQGPFGPTWQTDTPSRQTTFAFPGAFCADEFEKIVAMVR